jgi:hypothetical protein
VAIQHEHTTAASGYLDLYSFPIMSPQEIERYASRFKAMLFGAISKDDTCEINPISGYCYYAKAEKTPSSGAPSVVNLPRDKGEAAKAAVGWLRTKYGEFLKDNQLQSQIQQLYSKGKPLKFGFAPIPHPDWIQLIEAYPVKSRHHSKADHWLCKFEVVLPLGGSKFKIWNANIDLRIGAATNPSFPLDFQLQGLSIRYRPLIYWPSAPLEKFLDDTGNPAHLEHETEQPHEFHLESNTHICYILSDDNAPQFNLLPYEVTIAGGHEASILPASKQSLWVELQVEYTGGCYIVFALIMGGSGNYEGKWGHWKTLGGMDEAGNITHSIQQQDAHLEHSSIYDGVAVSKITIPLGIWDIVISVYDKVHNNSIHKSISLALNPQDNGPVGNTNVAT